MAHDSADVWKHRDLYHLDATGERDADRRRAARLLQRDRPALGQPALPLGPHARRRDIAWWIERFRATLGRFDAVRLDHFIGFTRYWAIPGDEPTAINGRWRRGPGAHFFDAVRRALRADRLPLIAEDLGVVTPEVKALRDDFGLPGIKILQFAFGTDPQAPDFLPHNYPRNAVVYTGTHDNDTTAGWFHDPGSGDAQRRADREGAAGRARLPRPRPGGRSTWPAARSTGR